MGTVADEILNNDVGAVGLERDAVYNVLVCQILRFGDGVFTISVVNERVLDDNVVGTVSVPTIRVGNLDTVNALFTC